ncbi:MAG: DUF1573 domain-containing protein [Phycisphaerales bacterium]|jgi:hypothetical protein|nr:DUF1573 domain-containing protein [Phycisphaerales bacterium]
MSKHARLTLAFAVSVVAGQVAIAQYAQPQPLQPAAGAPAPSPKIAGKVKVEPSEIDLGQISNEEPQNLEFTLTNVGEGVLTIPEGYAGLRASCGCTQPSINKNVLQPGESATIAVVFNPANKRGTTDTRVTILSDDPTQPQAVVHVRSFVKETMRVEPRMLGFGRQDHKKTAEQTFKVLSSKPDFKVEGIDTGENTPWLKGEVIDRQTVMIEGEVWQQTQIKIVLGANAPVGHLRGGTVAVLTNDPKNPKIVIPVAGEILGDLSVGPERLSFGLVNPGEVTERLINISSRSGKKVEIIEVEQEINLDTPLHITQAYPNPEQPFTIQISVAMTSPEQPVPIRGKLMVHTTDPDQPMLEIPLYATMRTRATRVDPNSLEPMREQTQAPRTAPAPARTDKSDK